MICWYFWIVGKFFSFQLDDIDLIMGTLETSIGSIGGFCAGTTYVVEHQTLAGLGYCFSASLPPMLAAGALKSLELMEENRSMFGELQERALEMHNSFEDLPGLVLVGNRESVVKHLRLRETHDTREQDRRVLDKIVVKVRFCFWLLRVSLRVQGSAYRPVFTKYPRSLAVSLVTRRWTNSSTLHLYTGPIYRVI